MGLLQRGRGLGARYVITVSLSRVLSFLKKKVQDTFSAASSTHHELLVLLLLSSAPHPRFHQEYNVDQVDGAWYVC